MTIKTIAAVGRLEFSLTVGAEVFKKKGRKEALHLLIKFAIKNNKSTFSLLTAAVGAMYNSSKITPL
jgi:hypothetical protein